VFPVQKAAPAAVFIESAGSEVELRRQLRTKNGVSELSSSTSVIRFSVAPTGSFGFITPKLLGMALITQSPDLPLEQIPPVSNAFEIHKLADGSGMLVGFVETTLKPQLTASDRPKNIRLGLYSNPSIKAPHIVAVPLVKLVVDRMPTRLDPKDPAVRSCSIWICRVPPTVPRLKPGPRAPICQNTPNPSRAFLVRLRAARPRYPSRGAWPLNLCLRASASRPCFRLSCSLLMFYPLP
jgi:hypothetical protein